MAAPRIFISSTCYDLQEVRSQLRSFIETFGYEPVLSDYGDIFFDYNLHVQDACLEEIKRCQMFILIIGNSYGSIYHKDESIESIPDSVTLKELKKALEVGIKKHIFINKFVDHDYKSYKKILQQKYKVFFEKEKYSEKDIESEKKKIRLDLDKTYPYSNNSYKSIFYFLDLLDGLNINNGVVTFEHFDEIRISLKKQWASFLHDSLMNRSNTTEKQIDGLNNKIDDLTLKIDQMFKVKKEPQGSEVIFDIEKIPSNISKSSFKYLKKRLGEAMNNIIFDPDDPYNKPRVFFHNDLTNTKVIKWLDSLEKMISDYKWSDTISTKILFSSFGQFSFDRVREDVDYSAVLELYQIYISISQKDKDSFATTICTTLKKYYRFKDDEDVSTDGGEDVDPNDIPF